MFLIKTGLYKLFFVEVKKLQQKWISSPWLSIYFWKMVIVLLNHFVLCFDCAHQQTCKDDTNDLKNSK